MAKMNEVKVVGWIYPRALGIIYHELDVLGNPRRLDGAQVHTHN